MNSDKRSEWGKKAAHAAKTCACGAPVSNGQVSGACASCAIRLVLTVGLGK